MENSTLKWPAIDDLMSGWFHQDYDLNGEIVKDIIAAFKPTVSEQQQTQLLKEIEVYLSSGGNIDVRFQEDFNPCIIPSAFSGNAKQFLLDIQHVLAN